MKTITVLGSTGSIGTNTLDVVRRSPHQYLVYALAAGQNVDTLSSQILEFRPEVAVVATSDGLARLSDRLLAAGLEATYQAVCHGKRVGLANKEVLVSAGKLVMEAVREHRAELVPVDSEH